MDLRKVNVLITRDYHSTETKLFPEEISSNVT